MYVYVCLRASGYVKECLSVSVCICLCLCISMCKYVYPAVPEYRYLCLYVSMCICVRLVASMSMCVPVCVWAVLVHAIFYLFARVYCFVPV